MLEKIKEIISEQLGTKPDVITADMRIEDLDGDSIDAVEIIMGIEDEFGVEFPDDLVAEFDTIQSIMDYIENIK